ncbi:MAG: SCO family protein [Caldilineaceae bacterium]|nr:SCO family protein [Caldilineaceae bacterium]
MIGVIALIILPGVALAHDAVPHSSAVLDLVGFDQRLDHEVSGDLAFRDENGKLVHLAYYLQEKPVILALSYFECTDLCPLVRQGLVESLRPLGFTVGKEFDVVFVSIDPKETPETAAAVKAETVATYDRPGSEAGWHFLTGDHEMIDQLADEIGFRFAYDGERDEYAHASGLVLLTPAGRIARYFYGIEYATQDVRLGLVEASQNRIGSPIDQLLLLCYHYDPSVGKYSLLIMNVLRLAGIATVAGLALFILMMRRQESHRAATLG